MILQAKIIWFPEYLTSINYDYLEDTIDWKEDHLENVRNYMKEDGLLRTHAGWN